MFSSVTWLRLSACSWRVEAWVRTIRSKAPYLKNAMRDFRLSQRWPGSAAQRSKIKVTASSWSSCLWMQTRSEEFVLTNYTFKREGALISFCRFTFHFKVISQKRIKGISHRLKDDLDQSWMSQHQRPLALHSVISIYRLTADRQTVSQQLIQVNGAILNFFFFFKYSSNVCRRHYCYQCF